MPFVLPADPSIKLRHIYADLHRRQQQTEMANRLLKSFSLEELQSLFEDVARCTLNPAEEHLCKILKAQDQ